MSAPVTGEIKLEQCVDTFLIHVKWFYWSLSSRACTPYSCGCGVHGVSTIHVCLCTATSTSVIITKIIIAKGPEKVVIVG